MLVIVPIIVQTQLRWSISRIRDDNLGNGSIGYKYSGSNKLSLALNMRYTFHKLIVHQ